MKCLCYGHRERQEMECPKSCRVRQYVSYLIDQLPVEKIDRSKTPFELPKLREHDPNKAPWEA